MAFEDYLEPEVGVAVAITAALTSPKVRGTLRQGAVYGLAGLLKAGDAVSSVARGARRGLQSATAPENTGAEGPAETGDAEVAAPAPKRARKSPEAGNGE